MKRRNFLKKGCSACAAIAGMGLLMQRCSPLPIVRSAVKNHRLTIPLSSFNEEVKMVRVENDVFEDDIILIKNENGFTALLMECTHEGAGLMATNTKLICNAHGSQFDLKGNVLKSPALKPLKRFEVTANKTGAIIQLSQT